MVTMQAAKYLESVEDADDCLDFWLLVMVLKSGDIYLVVRSHDVPFTFAKGLFVNGEIS
jgi:hypothetical protein